MTPTGIKRLRLKLGLTQLAFAKKMGVSFQTINRWERGKFCPSSLAVEKIKQMVEESEKVENE